MIYEIGMQNASRGELGVNNGDDNRQQAKKKETPANQIDLLESGNGPQKPFGPSQTRLSRRFPSSLEVVLFMRILR